MVKICTVKAIQSLVCPDKNFTWINLEMIILSVNFRKLLKKHANLQLGTSYILNLNSSFIFCHKIAHRSV